MTAVNAESSTLAFTKDVNVSFGALDASSDPSAFWRPRHQGRAAVMLAIRTTPPEWREPCLRQLDRLGELRDNWDSYGAKPIHPLSIDLAKRLLMELARVDAIESPTVSASPEGNAALCWDNGNRSLDLEIQPDGSVEYVYLNEGTPSNNREGATYDASLFAVFLTQW